MEMGIIFDWDGVIIDSSKHHEESWERLAREEGKILPEDHFEKGFGMKNEVIIPNLLEWSREESEIRRLSLRKEALYREVVQEWGVESFSGVENFLKRLETTGIPRVIGSSTQRLNLTTVLEVLGWSSYFSDLVSAEDVSHGKPDPEVFLRCATRLKLKPEQCIVFEDAHVGIEAAKAAGIKVVAVATTHEASELKAADLVIQQLDELTIEDLERLIN